MVCRLWAPLRGVVQREVWSFITCVNYAHCRRVVSAKCIWLNHKMLNGKKDAIEMENEQNKWTRKEFRLQIVRSVNVIE